MSAVSERVRAHLQEAYPRNGWPHRLAALSADDIAEVLALGARFALEIAAEDEAARRAARHLAVLDQEAHRAGIRPR